MIRELGIAKGSSTGDEGRGLAANMRRKPDPVAAIRFRMAQQGLTAKDLAPFLGSRSRVSEVLSGRRRLSLKCRRERPDGQSIC